MRKASEEKVDPYEFLMKIQGMIKNGQDFLSNPFLSKRVSLQVEDSLDALKRLSKIMGVDGRGDIAFLCDFDNAQWDFDDSMSLNFYRARAVKLSWFALLNLERTPITTL